MKKELKCGWGLAWGWTQGAASHAPGFSSSSQAPSQAQPRHGPQALAPCKVKLGRPLVATGAAPPEGPESLWLGILSGGRSPGHHPHLPPRVDCPEEASEALEALQPVPGHSVSGGWPWPPPAWHSHIPLPLLCPPLCPDHPPRGCLFLAGHPRAARAQHTR